MVVLAAARRGGRKPAADASRRRVVSFLMEGLVMTRRTKVVLTAAVLWIFINLAGAAYALVQHEMLHACVHIVLLLAGEYVVWRLALRNRALY
jgi:hypothetical protein